MFKSYLHFWTEMADYFQHNEYIIGYDILNEVYPSQLTMQDTFEQTIESFDMDILQPLYGDIAQAIWNKDDKKLIFF